jgi:hypothetical protein
MSANNFMPEVVARIIDLVRAKTTKLHPSADDIDLEAMFHQVHREYPNLTPHGINRAFGIAHDKLIEQDHKLERERFLIDFGIEMFEGLPEGLILDEAVRIKAKQGNKLALRYLAEQGTKEARLIDALSDAAHAAHPQVKVLDYGRYQWNADGEFPSTDALIEWFQINHPNEAREIERAVEEEST